MNLLGYYIESFYPNYMVYRIIIVNSEWELNTFTTAVNNGDNIKNDYPDFIDLGGFLFEEGRFSF